MNNIITVGQTLYREYKKRNDPPEITELTVSKIATKYIYVVDVYGSQYAIDKKTLEYRNNNYGQYNFTAYVSKQDILDNQEKECIIRILRKNFDYGSSPSKATIHQLREVMNILALNITDK